MTSSEHSQLLPSTPCAGTMTDPAGVETPVTGNGAPRRPEGARPRQEHETLRSRPAAHVLEMEHLSRRKDALIAIASHDLKTPLTSILGYAQFAAVLLASDAPNLDKVKHALKYSPDETRVTIEVTQHDAGIEIAVSDQGIGIPADELMQAEGADTAPLFERFHRTPQAHASGVPGAGLGLYICRGIVAAHGGRLWAESPGLHLGSTFRFTVPDQLPAG